jgi:hypothetical protein
VTHDDRNKARRGRRVVHRSKSERPMSQLGSKPERLGSSKTAPLSPQDLTTACRAKMICRSLELARAAFAAAVEEKPLYGALLVKHKFRTHAFFSPRAFHCNGSFPPLLGRRAKQCGRDDLRRSLPSRKRSSRHNLVFGGSPRDPNHDAVLRIGGEAPRRWGPILYRGIGAMGLPGHPPPRILALVTRA